MLSPSEIHQDDPLVAISDEIQQLLLKLIILRDDNCINPFRPFLTYKTILNTKFTLSMV